MSNTQKPLSAIEEVFHNYGQRRAALDYAFFKLNLPEHDVALLVDFIIRRRIGVDQVRVSVHALLGRGPPCTPALAKHAPCNAWSHGWPYLEGQHISSQVTLRSAPPGAARRSLPQSTEPSGSKAHARRSRSPLTHTTAKRPIGWSA